MTKVLYQNILVFFLYCIFFWYQDLIFYRLQNSLLPSIVNNSASLVFLPHGIRVLGFIFFGPKIFPGLLLAHIITGLAINLIFFEVIITSLFSTSCVLFAIKIYTGDLVVKKLDIFSVKFIFTIAILAAIINSLTVNTSFLFLRDDVNFSSLYGSEVFKYIIGDLIGTIILFYIFIFVRKVIRQSFY
tara:strand:+ start:1469 stop:2029 length:561 start_codon:yes stop_codon:yes gene_type:complete